MLRNKAKLKEEILEMKRTYNYFLDSLISELENGKIPTQDMIDRADPEKLRDRIRLSMFSTCDFETNVTEYMKMIGVPAHLKGYYYLRDAIVISLKENSLPSPTKELYPQISKKYKTTPDKVERSIRTAIETTWKVSDLYILNEFFGEHKKERPTNSEFIATVADKIRMDFYNNQSI